MTEEVGYIPCTNVAKSEDNFLIDVTEYLEICRKYTIIAIVHSHPDSSCEPSEYDINSCNAIGIPYYIYSYPNIDLYILEPKKSIKPLLGRQYSFGISDCFEASRDYLQSKNIIIPSRGMYEDNWWEKGLDYFSDSNIQKWGFIKVNNLQENDLLTFKMFAPVVNHCGIYVGEDKFFHHAINRLSCIENIYPLWKKYLTGIYRYEKKINI